MQKNNKLKKGDLFQIKVDSLERLTIINSNDNNYEYKLSSKKSTNEKIKNQYLTCIYLGDGLAREYITSTIFNIIGIDDVNICSNCNSYVDFLNKYNRAIRYPLLSNIDDKAKFESINRQLVSNNESDIKLFIKSLETTARNELLNKYDIDEKKVLKKTL